MNQQSRSSLIRAAAPLEAEVLTALAMRSKAYWGYDAEFMQDCVDELKITPDKIKDNPTYLLENARYILGFYMLEPFDHSVNDQEIELGYLFVDPNVIGQGCGTQLMRHAKAKAFALGYRTMLIQGDPNAAPFYQAMGAQQIGTRPSDSVCDRTLPLFQLDLNTSQSS